MSQSVQTRDAREVAAAALGEVAQRMPRVGAVEPEVDGLGAADRRLATAIVRCGVQRWLTLEAVLDAASGRRTAELEPMLRGVLTAGAAQLVFMDRLPSYAVVDRGVEASRRLVRPGAAKLTNAVLRKVAGLIAERRDQASLNSSDAELPGGADRVSLLDGEVVMKMDVLPPATDRRAWLAAAWSVPRRLVDRWSERYGVDEAEALCRCAARTPAVIVATGKGDDEGVAAEPGLSPHVERGFAVWSPSPEADDPAVAASLTGVLARHPGWRVQDPTSARAVGLAAGLADSGQVHRVLDYCAGRGTKTHQLAAMFPGAEVVATDTRDDRRRDLAEVFAASDRVTVCDPDAAMTGAYDLILLDVPCSNTGVLARRPEARYRFSKQDLLELTKLQRTVLAAASARLSDRGHVLYSTCSVEAEENDRMVQGFYDRSGFEVAAEHATLPRGETAETYRDGGYAALLRRR